MGSKRKHWILALFLLISGAIQAHVQLETKLTEASFSPGQTIKLSWKILVEHDQLAWDIQYSMDGGTNWEVIEKGLPVGQLSFDWLAPNIESAHMVVRIVQDNDKTEDYWDNSDEFTITKEMITSTFDRGITSIETQALPNPAFSEIELDLQLPRITDLTVSIYDMSGLLLKKWLDPNQEAGEHIYRWSVSDTPAGTYYFEIQAGTFLQTHPFVVLH